MLSFAQPTGDVEGRIRACREALSMYPDDPRALLELGDLHFAQSEHARCLSCYERVAELYHRTGKSLKAAAVYKQMHALIAQNAPALAWRFQHTYQRLAGIFSELGLFDDSVGVWLQLAELLVQRGAAAEAITVLESVVESHPQHANIRFRLAELRASIGEVERAAVDLERVVTLTLAAGQREAAIVAVERLAGLPKGKIGAKKMTGHARLAAELRLERGTRDDAYAALGHLQQCYRANARSLPTMRLLVKAFDVVGERDKANEVLKEAARLAHAEGARSTLQRIVTVLHERAPGDPSVAELSALD